jgi:hypothetical protein
MSRHAKFKPTQIDWERCAQIHAGEPEPEPVPARAGAGGA